MELEALIVPQSPYDKEQSLIFDKQQHVNANKIIVLGYYGKSNYGDECFKQVFLKYLSSPFDFVFDFVNPENPLPNIGPDVRCVVVGGGDLINSYFLDRLKPFFDTCPCPIYAVGIGFPFPNMIEEDWLSRFDYIIHRTQSCHERLVKALGPNRVLFCPDLVWMMSSTLTIDTTVCDRSFVNAIMSCCPFAQTERAAPSNTTTTSKRIIVCLARPMISLDQDKMTHYNAIVRGIATFLLNLARQTTAKKGKKKAFWYQIEFVPFGTRSESKHEDDRLIHSDVLMDMVILNKSDANSLPNVIVHSETPVEPISFFKSFNYAICSRYHAHIFALMAGVPLISISCTNKVSDLMGQAGLEDLVYSLPVHDDQLYPLSCDANEIQDRFNILCDNESEWRQQISSFAKRMQDQSKQACLVIQNLFRFLPKPITRFLKEQTPVSKVAHFILNELCKDELTDVSINDIMFVKGAIKKAGVTENQLDRLVRLISYLVVGKPVSAYSYGLREQLLSDEYCLHDSCHWIHQHFLKEKPEESDEFPDSKKFCPFIDSNKQTTFQFEYPRGPLSLLGMKSGNNVHRSGWDYVLFNLLAMQNPTSDVIFDT